jgi:aryl-alcohol dehydrogenase-like predicted oxidoreductase
MKASRLALGSAQFGSSYGVTNFEGVPSEFELAQLLEIARENGIDVVDTAPVYGNSEERLGRIGLNGMKIITKISGLSSVPTDQIPRWMVEQVGRSLDRLRLSSLYSVLLHDQDALQSAQYEQIVEGLHQIVKQGLSSKVGLSVYYPEELMRQRELLEGALVQVPANLFDRRFLGLAVQPPAVPAELEVHARSAFLQGLLLQAPCDLPPRFRRWLPLFTSFSNWCELHSTDRMTACLAIFAQYPRIKRIVVGVARASQLLEILSAFARSLNTPVFPGCTDDEDLLIPMKWESLQHVKESNESS